MLALCRSASQGQETVKAVTQGQFSPSSFEVRCEAGAVEDKEEGTDGQYEIVREWA
jgi:hypothetical protein